MSMLDISGWTRFLDAMPTGYSIIGHLLLLVALVLGWLLPKRDMAKVVTVGSIALATAVAIHVAQLQYVGYCLAEGRQLSDQEKIDRALDAIWRKSPGVLWIAAEKPEGHVLRPAIPPWRNEKGQDKVGVLPVPYTSLAEFQAANPNCCKIASLDPFNSEGGGIGFSGRTFHSLSGYVVADYQVRYTVHGQGTQSATHRERVAVSHCGQATEVPSLPD